MEQTPSARLVDPSSSWMSWLDGPMSGWWCALGWVASSALFVGLAQLLGGPAIGDAVESTNTTWAIAHGQFACAFRSAPVQIAPLYPYLSGGIAAIARIGHSVAFPGQGALGPNCDNANKAITAWSQHAHAVTVTIRIGYTGWLVLMAGIVSRCVRRAADDAAGNPRHS